MPFAHVPTGMPLDVVLAGSGLEDEFIERAKPTDIGAARVPLIDVADLIVGKILAGRPRTRGTPGTSGVSTGPTLVASASADCCGCSKRPSATATY